MKNVTFGCLVVLAEVALIVVKIAVTGAFIAGVVWVAYKLLQALGVVA